jgi:hypothetical protein
VLERGKDVLPIFVIAEFECGGSEGGSDDDGKSGPDVQCLSHGCPGIAEKAEIQAARRPKHGKSPSLAYMYQPFPRPRVGRVALARRHPIEVENLQEEMVRELADWRGAYATLVRHWASAGDVKPGRRTWTCFFI